MLQPLRKLILALTVGAQRRDNDRLARKALVLAAKLVRDPATARGKLEALQKAFDQHAAEVATWVDPDTLRAGRGGPFDACDLRHWLALAERAGVPIVPAVPILTLDEDEMSLASGSLRMPDNAMARAVRRRASAIDWGLPESDAQQAGSLRTSAETLQEKLFAAMDEVPEGWMVRSARCGSSELKSFAGAGAAGPHPPEVRLGPDLEVGPGWVRHGNRRMVQAGDSRTVELHAQGPGHGCVFLARPWIEAARYAVAEDPHRHGTPFAGKGIWPAEWRAFVERGRVVGVSWYYPWCGEATPENAATALEVARLAQRIADAAAAIGAFPRLWDVEAVRLSENPDLLARPEIAAALETFGREDVGCTLDFIESAEGLLLLEGGPANTPFGGGHPCGFAGCGGPPRFGSKTETEGVAFRLMDHVLLADPRTWEDGSRDGCILPWADVHVLAGDDAKPAAPSPEHRWRMRGADVA